jgi:hypothetical protein
LVAKQPVAQASEAFLTMDDSLFVFHGALQLVKPLLDLAAFDGANQERGDIGKRLGFGGVHRIPFELPD